MHYLWWDTRYGVLYLISEELKVKWIIFLVSGPWCHASCILLSEWSWFPCIWPFRNPVSWILLWWSRQAISLDEWTSELFCVGIWFLILKGVYKCSTSSITQLLLIPRLFGYHWFFDLLGTHSCFCHIMGFDATSFIFVHSLIKSHFLCELKIII